MFNFIPDFAYGHPGGFNPFMLNPGWLDAAYMNYAWTDYFRHQPHHPALSKGKYSNINLFTTRFMVCHHSIETSQYYSCIKK